MSSTKDFFETSILKDLTVRVPLTFDSDNPGYKTLNENDIVEIINFNIKSILLTIPGERIDRNFGVGLKTYLFELDNSARLGGLDTTISKQISKYLPWLNRFNVSTNVNQGNGTLKIKIKYKLNNPSIVDEFNLSLSVDEM